MTFSNQIKTLKENWLILIIFLAIILILSNLTPSNVFQGFNSISKSSADIAYAESSRFYPGINQDFAPEESDRKITKTISTSIETKRGNFDLTTNSLKNYIKESNSILINENINSYGEGINKRKTGSYSIQVPKENYESIISKIKNLGEIQSFNENLEDITGNYISIQDTLELEKQKLKRYQELFETTQSTEEKITLTDRLFEQERRIKYLEQSLNNQDLRIEYVNVYLTINEKQSNFANISLITLKEIIRSFINSFNKLITIIIWIIPWAIVFWIIRFFYKKFK